MNIQTVQDKLNLISVKTTVEEVLIKCNAKKFSKISDFPKEIGVYIVYENNEVVYVGASYSDTRTIYKRCKQYIGKSDTGATLRKKVQRINQLTASQAVNYIQHNFVAKFILMNKESQKNIKTIEHFLIGTFNTKYND